VQYLYHVDDTNILDVSVLVEFLPQLGSALSFVFGDIILEHCAKTITKQQWLKL